MTPEQLNQMVAYFNQRLQDDKNLSRDVYLESVLSLSNKDVAEKIMNGETVSYDEYKNILLGYQPTKEIEDFLKKQGFNLNGLNGYQMENDMFRRDFLFESCYDSSVKENKEIDKAMKNDFFGGKELSEKKQEFFRKKPLKAFAKYSENVFGTIFSAKNEQGEPTEKALDVDTVKQSLTAYQAMKDKVKSCGIFDILFHMPSYFGLKKNMKNLKNSLTEKGLSENLIDKVEKGESTPKEASMDFLYETDEKYRNLVDEKKLSKDEAFAKYTEKAEERKQPEKVEEIGETLSPKDPDADPVRPTEKNQRQSAAPSFNLSNDEKNRLREEGESKEGIETKKFSQFTPANRLKKKVYDEKAVDEKTPWTEKDLKNMQVRKEFYDKLDATVKQSQNVTAYKMKKAGKKAPIFNSHERRKAIKKLTALNQETNRLLDERTRKSEQFEQVKKENQKAEAEFRKIHAQIENMSPKEVKNFFKAQPELLAQYNRAKETMSNFRTENDRYMASKTQLEEALYSKLSDRNELMERYNKMAGTEKEYDSLINGFYTKKTVEELLADDFEKNNVTPEEKEQMVLREQQKYKREMKDRFINSRAELDRPLDKIKEDEAEYQADAEDVLDVNKLADDVSLDQPNAEKSKPVEASQKQANLENSVPTND